MSTHEPWQPGETPEEQAARREAYERLSAAARRVGLPLERLGDLLRQVANNETETRRFLSEQVYGVPDALLDDLLRVRLEDLPGGKGMPPAR
jgi:8-oxo-dGTP pyrophosphatase MutT (NUDIX family)